VKPRGELEHTVEGYATLEFAKLGWLLLKWVSPGFGGVPDRVLLTDDGRVIFIEFKRPGVPHKFTPRQKIVFPLLGSMRHPVLVIDTKAQVDQLIRDLTS
jgi:hypothetical protein